MRPALVILRLSALLVCAAIILLSLMPAPPQPLAFSGVDKAEHALAYALLSFLFCLGFLPAKAAPIRVLGILIAIFLLGAMIETIQPAVGRDFDWFDMASNACGILVGWLASLFIGKIRRTVRKEA
jgi:VanZ family protein